MLQKKKQKKTPHHSFTRCGVVLLISLFLLFSSLDFVETFIEQVSTAKVLSLSFRFNSHFKDKIIKPRCFAGLAFASLLLFVMMSVSLEAAPQVSPLPNAPLITTRRFASLKSPSTWAVRMRGTARCRARHCGKCPTSSSESAPSAQRSSVKTLSPAGSSCLKAEFVSHSSKSGKSAPIR